MINTFEHIENKDPLLEEGLYYKNFDSIIESSHKAFSAKKAFLTADIKQSMDKMLKLLLMLNDTGREEALKRVSELTRLFEYMGVNLNILLKPYNSSEDLHEE